MRNFLLCPKYNVVEVGVAMCFAASWLLKRHQDAVIWGVLLLVVMALSSWWQVRNDKWVG